MKQSTTALLAVLGLAAAGGVIYLATKNSSSSDAGGGDNETRVVKTYEGEQGVWSFAIDQGGTIIYGPEGPFNDQAAAQTAGDNWLAANPVL